MENKSGLHPTGRTVLVHLDPVPTRYGMVELHQSTVEKDQMAQVHGTLIATGPLAWETSLRAAVPIGSMLIIKRYAGEYVTGVDGVKYRIINDNDIYAIRDFTLPTNNQAKE